jgi:hypothetical protein
MWMCLTRRVDWRGTTYSHEIRAVEGIKRA